MKYIAKEEIDEINITSGGKQYRGVYDGEHISIEEVEQEETQSLIDQMIPPKKEEQEEQEDEERGDGHAPPYEDDNDSVFKSRLTSIMTDNKFDRKLRFRTRGRLDMTRLHRVPARAENVFSQKKSRQNKKYNVVLLVDTSGSMSGDKIKQAAKATAFLAKSFEGIGIDLAVVTFNHVLSVSKRFDETIEPAELFKRVYKRVDDYLGCNHDYDALHYAYTMFKGREGKNIVFVLSDGDPVTCPDGDNAPTEKWLFEHSAKGLSCSEKDENKHMHNLVRANKSIAETISLGIMSTVTQIPVSTRVDDLSELKRGVLKMLTSKIKRG